jgi:hypothetical protein
LRQEVSEPIRLGISSLCERSQQWRGYPRVNRAGP